MQKSRIDLAAILDVDLIGDNIFRGNSPNAADERVFGGQVLGQAMFAACRTVEARLPHSLHCYFIHTGDPRVPLIYEVERLRDGKSYSTRRVTVMQHAKVISSLMASFHKREEGAFNHQDKMPEVPGPEHSQPTSCRRSQCILTCQKLFVATMNPIVRWSFVRSRSPGMLAKRSKAESSICG